MSGHPLFIYQSRIPHTHTKHGYWHRRCRGSGSRRWPAPGRPCWPAPTPSRAPPRPPRRLSPATTPIRTFKMFVCVKKAKHHPFAARRFVYLGAGTLQQSSFLKDVWTFLLAKTIRHQEPSSHVTLVLFSARVRTAPLRHFDVPRAGGRLASSKLARTECIMRTRVRVSQPCTHHAQHKLLVAHNNNLAKNADAEGLRGWTTDWRRGKSR